MSNYEAIIGLETHIQLNTNSKIFCSCKADSWNDAPNTNICPVCTGLPGVLPVLNMAVVEKGIRLAAAVNAEIQTTSFFDRKNYFYPDLPKGYQISQYDKPLALGGYIEIPTSNGDIRRVTISKLHIEEDAGKTKNDSGRRLIDFNRCGVPLVEMVSGPDLRSAEEAAQYMISLRQLIRWINISEADMEKGHLRCDANISIRPEGSKYLNPKTEIKNLNSISAIRESIQAEIERQVRDVDSGIKIKAWTLDWDEDSGVLRKMRSKETEADYRYFREPDLLPIQIESEWISKILITNPELPLDRRNRFTEQFELPQYDAGVLTSEISLSEYFETAVNLYKGDPKKVSNWLMNDVMRIINDKNISAEDLVLTPEYLVEIIRLIDAGKINNSTGKYLLDKVEQTGRSPNSIVEEEELIQVKDLDTIKHSCQKIIDANPEQVAAYKKGKLGLIGWFVGQVMKQSGGKADPKTARKILEEMLN